MRRLFLSFAAVGILIGVPALVLQRWVAETRFEAIVAVLAWFVVVAVGLIAYARHRPGLRTPLLGAWAAILLGTVAVGYWTGFRDTVVDEDVAMAAPMPTGDRAADRPAPEPKPVEVATGDFSGADGHAGEGVASAIRLPGGDRVLTFTEFDVDPGVDVDVFLSADSESIDGAVELGGLKGNVGDQQYEIPASTDLRRYSNVILWCNPFTVRIAVAPLA